MQQFYLVDHRRYISYFAIYRQRLVTEIEKWCVIIHRPS